MNDLENIAVKMLLKEKVNKECPRCGCKNFSIIDIENLVTDLDDFLRDFKVTPVIAVACKNCGFLSFHMIDFLKSGA